MKTNLKICVILLTAIVVPSFANAEELNLHGAEVVDAPYVADCETCCYDPPWAHRTGAFGEFLYIRSRDSRVAYGEIIDGPIAGQPNPILPVQFGTLALVDQDYSPAFRVGGTWAMDCSTSLETSYTHFESDTSDTAAIDPAAPFVLRSLVTHPGIANAAADFQQARANYDVDYDLFDIDYRGLLWSNCNSAVNYRFGARYARKDQDFLGQFNNGVGEQVQTELDFEGGGLRVGLDAERHSCGGGLMFYGRGVASFIAGDFSGRYRLGRTVDPEIVDIDWEEGRIVSILELELGVGWQSQSGRVKATAGYMVSAWYNTVRTDDFIQSVRTNDYVDIGGMMTFDGLTSKIEIRY